MNTNKPGNPVTIAGQYFHKGAQPTKTSLIEGSHGAASFVIADDLSRSVQNFEIGDTFPSLGDPDAVWLLVKAATVW